MPDHGSHGFPTTFSNLIDTRTWGNDTVIYSTTLEGLNVRPADTRLFLLKTRFQKRRESLRGQIKWPRSWLKYDIAEISIFLGRSSLRGSANTIIASRRKYCITFGSRLFVVYFQPPSLRVNLIAPSRLDYAMKRAARERARVILFRVVRSIP